MPVLPIVGHVGVQVAPQFKGTQQTIAKEYGPAAEKAGKPVGSKLGSAIGLGLKVAGGAVVTGLGVALTKGFGRLTAIENARAKLSGLGHQAQAVEGIMKNATDAVKGTAFGLDEAATVAAGAVASGVKPGKELERTLRLTADAATIANVPMGEMGAIFNKVASTGKIQGEVLAQLGERGIPILQLLGESLGKTPAEVQKLASEGKIGFAQFQEAMEAGMGGAALKSGETLQGAFKNSMAAVGRFGANLMSGVYPKVREFFTGFIGFMGPMEEKAKVLGAALGEFLDKAGNAAQGLWDLLVNRDYTAALSEAFGLEEDSAIVGALLALRDGVADLGKFLTNETVPALKAAGEWIQKNKDWLLSLGAALTAGAAAWGIYTLAVKIHAAAEKFIAGESLIMRLVRFSQMLIGIAKTQGIVTAAQWAWNKAMTNNPIGKIIMLVSALVAGLVYFFTQTETGKKIWQTVWGAIQKATAVVVDWFQSHVLPVLQAVWKGIQDAAAAVLAWYQQHLAPVFTAVWGAVQDAIGSVVGWFSGTAAPAFQNAFQAIGEAGRWLWESVLSPVFTAIGDAARWLYENAIRPAFAGIQTAFQAVSGALNQIWVSTLKPVFDAIGSVVGWLWQHIIQPTFHNISQFVILAFDLIVYAWTNILQPALSALGSFLWNLWKNQVEKVFTFIGTAWSGMVNGIRDLWNGVLMPVFQLVGAAVWMMWTNYVQRALTFIGTAWGGMVNGIRDLWNGVLQPAINAVGQMFRWLWENVAQPVFGWIGAQWDRTVRGFKLAWESVLLPAIRAVGSWLNQLWTNYAEPVFKWIGDAWSGMVNGIKRVWNDVLKPVFQAVGDFVKNELVRRFEQAVKMIGDAWSGLKTLFATPVNWVLTHVWNNGIVKAFNAVAQAVDSSAKLQPANLIALGRATDSRGNTNGTGGRLTVGRRAKGGPVRAGQPYIVGEEGPELIFPDRNGFVATAKQTAGIQRDLTPAEGRVAAGRSPREAVLPMGEFSKWDAFKLGISNAGFGPTRGIGMALGSLMDGAESLLKPILSTLGSWASGQGGFGSVLSGMARKAASMVLGWAGKKDKESTEGGSFGGDYNGPRSGMVRPASGGITSWFGKRWGSIHSGIDFGVPVGSPIRAAWSGVVQRAAWNALAGHTGKGMVLGHGGGKGSYYGHLSQWLKSPGATVKAGEIIARSGNTGRSTGPHLHFGVLQGGRPVNANALFRDNGGELPRGLSMILNNRPESEWIVNKPQIDQMASNFITRGQVPGTMIVRIGEREFAGFVEDIGDARLAHHVGGAVQVRRQFAGA